MDYGGQEEKQEKEEISPVQARNYVGWNQGDDRDGERGTNLGNVLEVKFSDVRKRETEEFKIVPRFFTWWIMVK